MLLCKTLTFVDKTLSFQRMTNYASLKYLFHRNYDFLFKKITSTHIHPIPIRWVCIQQINLIRACPYFKKSGKGESDRLNL